MKALVKGRVSGIVLKSERPINFLGSVAKGTGRISDSSHDLYGRTVEGRVLVFPGGAGSSVGAYTIYSIKASGAAPLAMICKRADITVATGCAVAGIPLVVVSEEEFGSLQDGASVLVDAESDPPAIRHVRQAAQRP